MTYNTKYNFAKLKNIDDIKKLSLDSMFNLMRVHHKKFVELNKLVPQTEYNKNKKKEVLIIVSEIYNELHYMYKNKYNKKTDRLSAKNEKKAWLRLSDDYQYSSEEQEEEQEEKQEKQEEQKKQDKKPFDPEEIIEWMINKEDAHVNNELFKKQFKVETPSLMYKVLHKTNEKEKNSKLVNIFNSGLKGLREEIKKISTEEIEIERLDEIVRVVEMILDFNKHNQQGKGLKILTPNQMLSRLPITLAQLKAGNNSDKLRNEIRQLLYSLYRSKNMTKQVYNNLINCIWIK